MANTLKVTDMVLKEAQRIAHEKLAFITTTDLQYDSSFTYNANRGPTGQTLRVRQPNQYTRRTGSRVMDVQDQDESTQTITVATQDGVDMRFNSQELIQSVNSDGAFDNLSKNYIEPAMAVLCAGIESDYIAASTKATWNNVGTADTAMTDLSYAGLARAKLNQALAPKDNRRCVQLDSVTMGGLVNGLKGLFHDGEQIKKQYREGLMGRTAGSDWYEQEKLWTVTNAADVTGTINNGTIEDGMTELTVDAFTTALPVGGTFTIAGVNAVNPETKAVYPHLQQFVVTAVTGLTGINFQPAIQSTGAKQNVDSLPSDGDVVTGYGTASKAYVQPLMYHKEAFQFITADLPIMDDAHKCVTMQKDGLSMRCWQGSDIRNDELLMRIDILYGMASLRPDWACRITGANND